MTTLPIPARTPVKLLVKKAGYTPHLQQISILEDTTYNINLSILQRLVLLYYNNGTGVYYTDNGTDFTKASNYPTNYAGARAVYDGTKFVTIGKGTVPNASYTSSWTSEDGDFWIQTPSMPVGIGSNGVLAYGNNKFIYANYGYNDYVYSSTGIDWTASTQPLGSIGDGLFANGMFILHNINPQNQIAISTNGINWIQKTMDVYPNTIQYANGIFFLFSQYVTDFYTTIDFETYTQHTRSFYYGGGTGIAYVNGTYLIGSSSSNTYYLSSNLVDWSAYSFSSSTKPRNIFSAYNKFFVINNYGWVMTSDEGLSWTTQLNVNALFNYGMSNM